MQVVHTAFTATDGLMIHPAHNLILQYENRDIYFNWIKYCRSRR